MINVRSRADRASSVSKRDYPNLIPSLQEPLYAHFLVALVDLDALVSFWTLFVTIPRCTHGENDK